MKYVYETGQLMNFFIVSIKCDRSDYILKDMIEYSLTSFGLLYGFNVSLQVLHGWLHGRTDGRTDGRTEGDFNAIDGAT